MLNDKVNVVLFSGGYDSTVLTNFLIKNCPNEKIVLLHVEMPYNKLETEYANKIAYELLNKNSNIMYIKYKHKLKNCKEEYIPFRNLNVLIGALNSIDLTKEVTIYFGFIYDINPYPDCTKKWITYVNNLIALEYPNVHIEAPFIDFSKEKVYNIGCSLNVPLESTFSCNFPVDGKPCGKCGNCQWRKRHTYKIYLRR